MLARTLNSPFRRCRHVFNLQVFSENSCLVLAGFRRDLFDEITTDIGDTVIKLCHRDFLFVPILPELLHSFEPAAGSVEFLICDARLKECSVGVRAETNAPHVHADTVGGMLGRRHFVLGLNGDVPFVALSENRHVLVGTLRLISLP